MTEPSDLELLDALGIEPEPKKKVARAPREERIIAGFEDIQRFYEEHGRMPRHGEGRDIFERLYAVRLDVFANWRNADRFWNRSIIKVCSTG